MKAFHFFVLAWSVFLFFLDLPQLEAQNPKCSAPKFYCFFGKVKMYQNGQQFTVPGKNPRVPRETLRIHGKNNPPANGELSIRRFNV